MYPLSTPRFFKTILLLEDTANPLKRIQWIIPTTNIDHIYMHPQFFGKQYATIWIVKANLDHEAHNVYVLNPGTGGGGGSAQAQFKDVVTMVAAGSILFKKEEWSIIGNVPWTRSVFK